MAEKPEDQFNDEDKIARAKELYAIGCRNYYVRSYAEAADDLSEAAKLFGEVYGIDGAELGDVYLMYAKSLVAVGQGENKVVDVPDEEDEDEEDGGAAEGANGDEKAAEEEDEDNGEEDAAAAENGSDEAANGHAENEPEPSTSKAGEEEEAADGEGEEDEGGNLEVAWEVLQNAAMIFERVGGNKLKSLMDTYAELGEISLENSNFDAALADFNKALAVYEDLDDADQNQRVYAEIHYKAGLCHMMEKRYDESMKSFQKAADVFEEVLKREKAREDQTEEDKAKIKDLEEIQQELVNKIIEVRDTKAEELEFVKREMMKMYGAGAVGGASDPGAGSSSSSSSFAPPSASGGSSMKSPVAQDGKPKPTDISHLIKRKKPDTDPVQESPAKKQILETSPGNKVIVEKTVDADDEAKVQVVEN